MEQHRVRVKLLLPDTAILLLLLLVMEKLLLQVMAKPISIRAIAITQLMLAALRCRAIKLFQRAVLIAVLSMPMPLALNTEHKEQLLLRQNRNTARITEVV